METSVEQLIKERNTFASLSGPELEMVKELCETEEEFQTMKQFFHELENVSASRKTIINPEVKNSLDNIFSAKHPGLRANWTAPETAAAPLVRVIPLHQRTWVRIAAAAILILGTVPFWNMLRNELPANENKTTAQLQKPAPKTTIESPVLNEKAAGPDFNRTGNTARVQYFTDATAEVVVPAPLQAEPAMTSSTTLTASGGTPDTYTWSFSENSATKEPVTLSSIGLKADLHPDEASMDGCAVNALSLADQPDVLDLLVPAF